MAVSFFILAATIGLTWLWPSASLAGEPLPDQTMPVCHTYQSQDDCRNCHQAACQLRPNPSHAKASVTLPLFQAHSQQLESDECFDCHMP